MRPMLAQLARPDKLIWPLYVQPKLNGVRALQSNASGFVSREEIKWNKGTLGEIEDEIERLDIPRHVITDGELYCHGWSLQRINSTVAVKHIKPHDDINKITYNIFDVAGPGTFEKRFTELHRAYSRAVSKHGDFKRIKLVPTHVARTLDEATTIYHHYLEQQYEGIMYRVADNLYQPGKRVWDLLKRKPKLDAEFRVVSYTEGIGKHAGRLGALVLITEDGKRFNCGGGFSDSERISFWENPPIGQLAKIHFDEYSDSGIPLRLRFDMLIAG